MVDIIRVFNCNFSSKISLAVNIDQVFCSEMCNKIYNV